jgi:hypothetical protein
MAFSRVANIFNHILKRPILNEPIKSATATALATTSTAYLLNRTVFNEKVEVKSQRASIVDSKIEECNRSTQQIITWVKATERLMALPPKEKLRVLQFESAMDPSFDGSIPDFTVTTRYLVNKHNAKCSQFNPELLPVREPEAKRMSPR